MVLERFLIIFKKTMKWSIEIRGRMWYTMDNVMIRE